MFLPSHVHHRSVHKIVKIVNKSGVHQLLNEWKNTVQTHWILFNSENNEIL